MSFSAELSDIFDGLPGGRGPSLDVYMAQTDDDGSSEDELDAVAFVAWMKQNAEAARQERLQLQAKGAAENQSTGRKRSSKARASESGESGRPVTRQSRQGALPLSGKSSRRSSRKPRKSFDVSEIGGRKISLEVEESDSIDTAVEPLLPLPLGEDATENSPRTLPLESVSPEELLRSQPEGSGPTVEESSGTQMKESTIPDEFLSPQPDGTAPLGESPRSKLEVSATPNESSGTHPEGTAPVEESTRSQLEESATPDESSGTHPDGTAPVEESTRSRLEESATPDESSGTQPEGPDTLTLPLQLTAQSVEIQSPTSRVRVLRPSYIEPNDQTTMSTYVNTPVLQFDSTSSDDQGPDRNASKHVSRNASRHVSRSTQGTEDPHTDSSDGDQNMEMEALDATLKESRQAAPLSTVSTKRPVAKTTGRKRKMRRVCMPRKVVTTVKKSKAQDPTGSDKNQLHLSVTPLSMKKSLEKTQSTKSHSKSRSSPLNRSSGSPGGKSSVMSMAKRVVLSPKSSAKMSRNQDGSDDSLIFEQISPDPSPIAATPPASLPTQKGMAPHPSKVAVPTAKKASASSKKKTVSLSGVAPTLSPDSPLSTSSTRHDSMKSMRENAISIIASITDEQPRMEYSMSTPDNRNGSEVEPTPISGRRQSDASSVVSGYGVEQTPDSSFVVTIDGPRSEASEGDGDTTQSPKAAKKKRKKGPVLCYPPNKRPSKQKKPARESSFIEPSLLTESEDDTETELDGIEEEEEEEEFEPADVTVVASRPVMLDGYTPIDKGMPLNRSQIVKTVGGHKYKYSPVKGRKGVTPGRRRTKRTKVPVLSDGEKYVYTVDENVLQTVAGRVRPLEERNEKEQHRERKPKSSIRRAPMPNCLEMAFTETQDQEESVATFPLQTVDGDHLEVEFLRHLGVCPKKTLSGSDAVKSDPVIICPMFANQTCSVGCIFINAKCAKPQQVTAGASLVFILMSGMIEVEMRSGDQNYVKQVKPVTRFWIPEDVTYSIQNVDRVAAELVYVRLKQ